VRVLPGKNISNAPRLVGTGSFSYNPIITSGLRALLYVDGRLSSHYNTGSDLFPQKEQQSYLVVNGRVGFEDENHHWSVEFWAQNLLNKDYAQVAFNSPFQAGGRRLRRGLRASPSHPSSIRNIRAAVSSSRCSWLSRGPLA
jgi:Outer membrane receptor proteins, mostly Fe transport